MVASARQCENSDQRITDAKGTTLEMRRSSSVNPRKEVRRDSEKARQNFKLRAFSTAIPQKEKRENHAAACYRYPSWTLQGSPSTLVDH